MYALVLIFLSIYMIPLSTQIEHGVCVFLLMKHLIELRIKYIELIQPP